MSASLSVTSVVGIHDTSAPIIFHNRVTSSEINFFCLIMEIFPYSSLSFGHLSFYSVREELSLHISYLGEHVLSLTLLFLFLHFLIIFSTFTFYIMKHWISSPLFTPWCSSSFTDIVRFPIPCFSTLSLPFVRNSMKKEYKNILSFFISQYSLLFLGVTPLSFPPLSFPSFTCSLRLYCTINIRRV